MANVMRQGGGWILPFYDLKSLNQTTPFGQYMGEQLISELSELGFNVVEIRNRIGIA